MRMYKVGERLWGFFFPKALLNEYFITQIVAL